MSEADHQLQLAERARHRAEVRGVIRMSLPVVITMTSRAVMDIADFTMISFLPSDAAQAAILPAQVIMWSYIVLGMGTVSIIGTFTSQALGRNQDRACGAYVWQMLYIAVFFGLLGAAFIPTLPRLITALGHAPAVRQAELAYAQVAVLTAGPTIAAAGLGWFFIGIHRPMITMWSALEANVVNIAVSLVLIFGWLGFEPLGIAGAAWGTLAGVSYRALRLTLATLNRSTNARFATRSSWRPSLRTLLRMLRYGGPCGLQWTSEVIVWAIFITVLVGSKFGTEHMIATNAAWQYMRIAFLPSIGVGQALTSLVGKSIGAGEPERAMRETRIAMCLIFAYMGTLSLVYFFCGGTLVSWFNDAPEVVRLGGQIMICAAIFQLFDTVGINYTCALRGAGDTFWPALFFVVSQWTMIVGGGWLVATWFPQWGCIGPWGAATVLLMITAIFLWWRWHSRAWMKINIFGTPRAARVNAETEETAAAEPALASSD